MPPGGHDVAHRLSHSSRARRRRAPSCCCRRSQGRRSTIACAGVDGDPAIVLAFLTEATVRLEQEAMQLHDAVDAFDVGNCPPDLLRLSAQQRMLPAIAVGWQVGDQQTAVGDEFGVGQWWPRLAEVAVGCTSPIDAAERCRLLRRPRSLATLGQRNRARWDFFGPAAREIASRRISFSIVFLPSLRCSSRTWASSMR